MERLKLATKEQQDNENYVRNCIEVFGAEEFQFASKRLRTDAKFVLELVEKYPEILSYTQKIHERYIDEFGKKVDNERGKNLLFIMLCCGKNLNCYKYLDEKSATAYYDRVKTGYVKTGYYLGQYYRCYVALDKTQEVLNVLNEIRPEISEKLEQVSD